METLLDKVGSPANNWKCPKMADFVFGPGEAYPVSMKKLGDILTLDSGTPDFDSEHRYQRLGNEILFRFLAPSQREIEFFQGLIDRIPEQHWIQHPISELRFTNRNIMAVVQCNQVPALGVYTPEDKGIYLRRLQSSSLFAWERVKKNFFHECGHHWLEHISIGHRGFVYQELAEKRGFKIWENDELNYQEFWAEAYALRILRERAMMDTHPDVYRLIKETE